MKAQIVKTLGSIENLAFEDIPSPKISDNQVLIKVHYAGVNFPDILITEGKYQFQPSLPFSPGGEVAGEIKAVGSHIHHLQVGDRVMSGCSWGGYAEEVASFGTNTFKIPDTISFEQAAGFLQTFGTSYHALVDRAQCKSQETLLILGAAGGTGNAAVQIAQKLNLKVLVSASTQEKRNFLKSLGVQDILDTDSHTFRNQIKELTKGEGIDIIFDPVGGTLSELAFRSLRFGGRHLVVGFASGHIPRIPWNLPLLKSSSIVGVFWGRFFRDFPQENQKNVNILLNWLQQENISTQIYKIFSLSEATKALQLMKNKHVEGKILLKMP